MKKRRLNKKGKILVSIIVSILCIITYINTGVTGALAQTSNIWAVICIAEWLYIFFITPSILALIWDN